MSEEIEIKVLSEEASTCPYCGSKDTRTKTLDNPIGLKCDGCGKRFYYDQETGKVLKEDEVVYEEEVYPPIEDVKPTFIGDKDVKV